MARKNIEAIYPLSPMQQGLLFHTLYAPNSGMYFVQCCFTLQGELNVTAFEKAWQRILDRHSVLRTVFTWEKREIPLQVVYRRLRLVLEQEDWSTSPSAENRERLEAYLRADRARGFQLSKTPPMRLSLIRVDTNIYECIWSHHHILLDGWSVFLILKEVFTFYEAFCQDREPSLKPSRSYQDFISWLERQDLSKARTFWQRTLRGFTAPTPLNAESASGSLPKDTEDFSEQKVSLSAAATAALQTFTRKNHVVINTLIQGAWAVLLSRYSGEKDVVFGSTVSGRPAELAGVESMVGLFINTLPVRLQICPKDLTLRWLKRLQHQLLELHDYEYSPLVQVQEWSEVPRGSSLFESLVLFQNYPVNETFGKLGNLEIRQIHSIERTNYPLTIVAKPGSRLMVQIMYHRTRFDDATINRILGHLQMVLAGMIACPDQRLSDLPLLTEAERHQLVVEWNDTALDYSRDRCVHELFEKQVERTPDSIAMVFEDQRLTYRELDGRANRLAHYLRKRGVGPEVLVGIFIERSLEMVVGLLGILKVGGAYVPLDPTYPEERLSFIFEDAQVQLLLTQERLLKKLKEPRLEAICLDSEWEAISREKKAKPKSELTPGHLAYVIYTSGSTGKPKGVQIPHQAVVNFLRSMGRQPGLKERDILVSVTTLSFDIAALELFLPITVGACTVIVSHETALDGNRLARTLDDNGSTVMQATPATWELLLRSGWKGRSHLKILCGGDTLSRELARELLEGNAELWNLYGPTETTIWSTTHKVGSTEGPLCIGRPIANTVIYLLDPNLEPVPVGVPGEMYIGGDGLARGYLNRPELTAEKFCPNPFSEEGGARMYKTGDLARYLPDGNIEFLGRLDHQVKIRGFRIELGEVEAVLGRHPDVHEVVVLVREDAPDDKRLVAYVIANYENTPKSNELRDYLRQKIPEYMAPSAYVMMDVFPLTPSGKVDRGALPPPSRIRFDLEDAYVAPRTPVEVILAGIWKELLTLERIGVHENFFELGGHSLIATQVMSRVNEFFQSQLPLRVLFETPTIERLANGVAAACGSREMAEKIARTVMEIEGLSEEDANTMLLKEKREL